MALKVSFFLLKHGINGKFFSIIRNIYTKDEACVKLKGKLSPSFGINIGVSLGCIHSPLLFNIFLCDLKVSLNSIALHYQILTLYSGRMI